MEPAIQDADALGAQVAPGSSCTIASGSRLCCGGSPSCMQANGVANVLLASNDATQPSCVCAHSHRIFNHMMQRLLSRAAKSFILMATQLLPDRVGYYANASRMHGVCASFPYTWHYCRRERCDLSPFNKPALPTSSFIAVNIKHW